jgi:hypothetical protein
MRVRTVALRAAVTTLTTLSALATLAGTAQAANVYVFSTGNATVDAAYASTLAAQGHTVTIGRPWSTFDGSVDLSPFDAVLMNHGSNWGGSTQAVPLAGQQQLVAFVNSGGGVITTEWIVYNHGTSGGNAYATLMSIVPVTYGQTWNSSQSTTLSLVTPDPVMNNGLPATFSIPLANFAGSETRLIARDGATTFYRSSNMSTSTVQGAAVAGWIVGEGRVLSLSSMPGVNSMADANYATLLGNAIDWVVLGPGPCGYDYNRDESLDLLDAQQMAQVFVGILTPEPNWLSGDFNGDENADLTDAQQLASYIVTGVCPF